MTASLFRLAPWLALIGVAWFGGCQYQRNLDLAARAEALLRRNAQLENDVGRVDTVYRADTLRLTRVRWRTDSVLVAVTDTLIHRDTVKVLVERERLACDSVTSTCEQRVAYRDSIISVKDSLYRIEQKRGTDWKTKLGWLLVGAAAGSLIPR